MLLIPRYHVCVGIKARLYKLEWMPKGTKVNYDTVTGMLAYLRMVLEALDGISGRVTLDAQPRSLQGSSVLGSSAGRAYRKKVKSDRSLRCIRRIAFLPDTIDKVTFSGPFSCNEH